MPESEYAMVRCVYGLWELIEKFPFFSLHRFHPFVFHLFWLETIRGIVTTHHYYHNIDIAVISTHMGMGERCTNGLTEHVRPLIIIENGFLLMSVFIQLDWTPPSGHQVDELKDELTTRWWHKLCPVKVMLPRILTQHLLLNGNELGKESRWGKRMELITCIVVLGVKWSHVNEKGRTTPNKQRIQPHSILTDPYLNLNHHNFISKYKEMNKKAFQLK